MRFYLYPHKRMTASEQPNSENFQLCFWRGISYRTSKSRSSHQHHHAGGKLWANAADVIRERADAFRRAMPTPHCPMPFYSALYHPASGIPTNWACCVIRSSWGSAETGLVQWEATLAQALCAIRAEALWVLRTPAAGFHTRRGALRGYGAPAVAFTSGPPDCCHLRPVGNRCKSLNLCVFNGDLTWARLSIGWCCVRGKGLIVIIVICPRLDVCGVARGKPLKKKRKKKGWTRVCLLVKNSTHPAMGLA